MREDDVAAVRERYRQRWVEYGYDPRTLGWNKGCQWVRFEAALEGIRPDECASVLDVGCGFGDMLGYLRQRGWSGRYVGTDVVPELIEEAARRYGGEFLLQDLSSEPLTEPLDMAVALGIFNHRVNEGNWQFIEAMIDAMWRSTKQVIVCDFLSSLSEPHRRQPHLFYADPGRLFEIASRYSRRIAIHHSYMPFEFQVKIWHDASYTVPKPVFGPYAHLAGQLLEPEP